jgi:hypothetical protein
MAFTQAQVLNLADHGPEVIADILNNPDAYTTEQAEMARRARRIRARRAELRIERAMAPYDNA